MSGVNGGLGGPSNLEESIESLSEILPEVSVFQTIGAVKLARGNGQFPYHLIEKRLLVLNNEI